MLLPEEDDLVSGPTLMYMKCTAIDKLKQLLVRRVADTSLGYGVWLGSTPKGRLTLLVAFLLIWILIYLSR